MDVSLINQITLKPLVHFMMISVSLYLCVLEFILLFIKASVVITDLILDLLKILPTDRNHQLLDIKNKDGNTILHEVATCDAMKDAAEEVPATT